MADENQVTVEVTPEELQEYKVQGILSYLFVLVPLLTKAYEKSAYVKFHTNQGIILWLALIVASFVGRLLAFIPFVGWILWLAVEIGALVLCVLGILNANKGEQKKLPLIGGLYTFLK